MDRDVVTPRAAALRILATRAELSMDPVRSSVPLADFQREGAARAASIVRRYGGVIVADSVGLGKTFIAAALIERVASRERRVAVVLPVGMKREWRHALRPITEEHADAITFISHGRLSRGYSTPLEHGLVVVDEAHAFRNPRTRRYRMLGGLIRTADVVLLTATPINNSLADLHALLRLFCADDAFRDVGIASIEALLRAPDPASLDLLRRAVIVRRVRSQIRNQDRGVVLPSGQRLQFPDTVALTTIAHPPLMRAADLEEFLKKITFAAYHNDANRVLLCLSLLKRLQSSRCAALATINRLLGFHTRFVEALRSGRLLKARALVSHSDDQLWFTDLVLPELPRSIDLQTLLSRVQHDVHALAELRAAVDAMPDTKQPALTGLLASRPPPARTVLFTEFRDTAIDLWRNLLPRFRVALVTGAGAFLGSERCSRTEVIRCFAPRSNHAPDPPPARRIDVLIATDILAEGLNLQDADAVISYDLPWNPVRLVQRAGRVDRIGSPHPRVQVYNFLPDRELDRMLGLVRRLRSKLHDMRAAVGQVPPVLEADELTDSYITALVSEDGRALDLVEAPAEPPITAGLAEAGPAGCVAATSPTPCRVLACFSSESAARLLIWDGERILADNTAAEQIVQKALESVELRPVPLIENAISACQGYLLSTVHLAASTSQAGRLAQLIRRRVMEYGVMVPPDLLRAADQAVAQAHACENANDAIAAIRAARTPDQFRIALSTMVFHRRKPRPAPPEWRFVAAIAAD